MTDTAALLTRQPLGVRAVQCWKENKAEVDAFLATFTPRWYYHPNPHGGWQAIHGSSRMEQQVWIGSWLVEIPEYRTWRNLDDRRVRELYEGLTDE